MHDFANISVSWSSTAMVCTSWDSTFQNNHHEAFFPWQRLVKEPHTPWPSEVPTEQWWPVTCLQLSSESHSPQVFLVPATSIDLTWPSAAPRLALKSGNGRGPWVRHGVQWGGTELGEGTCPPYMSWSHFLPSRQQAGKESAHRADNAALSPSSSVLQNHMGPLPIVCLIWCPGWSRVQLWTYTVFINI